MLAILGPRSINEKKFTRWSTRLRALGLDWDTDLRSVSMPEEKIAKALLRVQAMLRYKSATRTELCKLLGSLRHVRSCIRSAKPLFQRIASLHRRAPRWGKITISEGAILDLQWFQHILQQGRLCSVPLKFFGDLPAPDVQLYMDASDSGHCALHPAKCEYIRLQFDDKERLLIRQGRLSINIREQLGAVLALLCWGREWCPRTTSEWKSSVNTSECQSGSRSKIRKHNHYYWLPSPFIAGPEEINTAEPRPVPFNLHCATLAGIIGHLPDSNLNYDRTTPSQLLECDEQAQQRGYEIPSRGKYSNGSCATLTSNNPSTAFLQGLRYWAFFLLRSAEYLAVKGRRRIYTLQVRDVILQDELGLQTSNRHTAVSVEITLRGQKNDQQGHGTKRVLSRSGHRALCPVFAGRLLMENARNLQLRPEDPISSIKASTMLPAETMSKVLHAAAKATG
ncbi:hypothetical protein L915_00141 [Phytophthora nicotianae]|uniref:Uncharacterized protein n=1 Tax=Phytophthora nicotianae TaxID=4792 RepID=W2HPV3_PHYNI|nr:hypothetical protein L915_00141 [Phytophthora nicotianae]